MSNEEKMDGDSVGSGQSGKRIELTLDQLNDNEREVVRALSESGTRMKIRQIQEYLGWHKPDRSKGNSRVRNALRRLVRAGLVLHDKELGDGTYVAVTSGPRPVPLTDDQALEMRMDYRYSDQIKKSDCTFYNACLDQAISGKWEGFSCMNCSSYSEPDQFQREMDGARLNAMLVQAENLLRTGKAGRKRGVKPGADAKRTLRVVAEDDGECAPLVEAFAID